jgi:hypothetical protein
MHTVNGKELQAASHKPQAASHKPQAASPKPYALSHDNNLLLINPWLLLVFQE